MKKVLYIAGGCFWGVEEYFSRLKGVISTTAGYANGDKANPTYEEVKSHKYHHAEAVKIEYDDGIISLEKLLEHFLRFVDPYAINKQGEDEGEQYRSGVYFVDDAEEIKILSYFNIWLWRGFTIEVKKLVNFYPAEEYHQEYLKKNPKGYCHINLNLIKKDELK